MSRLSADVMNNDSWRISTCILEVIDRLENLMFEQAELDLVYDNLTNEVFNELDRADKRKFINKKKFKYYKEYWNDDSPVEENEEDL